MNTEQHVLTVEVQAANLVRLAHELGLNLTIHLEPLPPLAMGNHRPVVTVWPARSADGCTVVRTMPPRLPGIYDPKDPATLEQDRDAYALINAVPLLQSLLYDFNLLPECIARDDTTRWAQMHSLVSHFRGMNPDTYGRPHASIIAMFKFGNACVSMAGKAVSGDWLAAEAERAMDATYDSGYEPKEVHPSRVSQAQATAMSKHWTAVDATRITPVGMPSYHEVAADDAASANSNRDYLSESSMLRNLLARIHGDGGHYLDKHGLEKTLADAEALLGVWRAQCQRSMSAAATLQRLGYTFEGGELWKPPLGEAPNFDLVDAMERRNDAAYLERNQVVAALAKAFPSGIARTAIEGWSEDWHGVVYVDVPTGQCSWHFHDSQAYLFDGLPPYAGQWDGHTTEEKYARLAALQVAKRAATDQIWRDEQGRLKFSASGPTTEQQLAIVQRAGENAGLPGYFDALCGWWRGEDNAPAVVPLFKFAMAAYQIGLESHPSLAGSAR